jgi:hypothetical protein
MLKLIRRRTTAQTERNEARIRNFYKEIFVQRAVPIGAVFFCMHTIVFAVRTVRSAGGEVYESPARGPEVYEGTCAGNISEETDLRK